MPDGYKVARLDDVRHSKWPRWSPIRHALDVQAFGINLWRHEDGGDVIPEHDESDSGHEELYVVLDGHATFTLDGEEVDAPKGTLLYIRDPAVTRKGVAKDPATSVLTIGGWSDKPFEVSEWETEYMKES
jgi:quercetin dioxygenase-like cupin family protein